MEFLIRSIAQALQLLISGDPLIWHALFVSLFCTIVAVLAAALVAIPYGAWLGLYKPRAHLQVLALRVGMSVPTVLIGLLLYTLFTKNGLLGSSGLLFTRSAIIVGEFLLAFPLLGSLTHGICASLDRSVTESAITLGASRWQALGVALGECRPALLGALLAAFGRCLTELGIVMTVGGNIANETRTLPSTIQLEISRADNERALASGLILLVLALTTTLLAHYLAASPKEESA